MKVLKEWYIQAAWGKIALISWGNPTGKRVLLVHGRQDSAATFIPLLDYCPESFYYVAPDMPGNGRSDPFPIGVKLMRYHFIAALEVVVKHLGWDQFNYVGHSMGCEQGLFFNVIYPNRITKFIHLDIGPSLARLQVHNYEEYYATFYRDYYRNYNRDNFEFKIYSKEKALKAVMRARHMTEEQAELILERNLIHIGDGQYRLSWDKRLLAPAPQNYPPEYYVRLFSLQAPPSLLLAASDQDSRPYKHGKDDAAYILNRLEEEVANFKTVVVSGNHDVHFVHPERVAKYFVDFLVKDTEKSKL